MFLTGMSQYPICGRVAQEYVADPPPAQHLIGVAALAFPELMVELAEIAAWRRAYAQMGLKPTQYRSAAEALLRRFRRGEELPRLHPLVDLGNAISLAFALPVAVFDLAEIEGYMEVRQARGDEQHLTFHGGLETPEPGEVIFADAARHAHARRWTFRGIP